MAKTVKSIKTGNLFRSFELDRASMDDAKRTVTLSFSSEQPVKRWFGTEILSHDRTAVDLSRLNNGGAVLVDHDTRDQVGVVDSAEIGTDKKGRAVVRFGNSPRANEIYQDVKDGIRRLVSVGYQITRMVAEGDTDPNGNMDDEAIYRAVEWCPYEISLVAIPADTSVGVGRSDEANQRETIIEFSKPMKRTSPLLDLNPADGGGAAPATPVTPAPAAPAIVTSPSDIRKEEQNRIREIISIGTKFRKVDAANTAVENGSTVEAFRKIVMDGITSPEAAAPTAPAGNAARSVGDFLVNSEAYRAFAKQAGRRSMSFDVPMGFTRTTGDPATTTGLTSIDKQPGIVLLGVQAPRIADLMTQTPTQNTTIRYISENTLTNAAAAVAENGALPEATWDLIETDAAVKKVGVIGRVTEEFFQDYDATRDYINNRLAYMVGIKEDNALLNADASANQIRGLLQFTGIQTQAQGADTALDALYKGINKVRTVGFFEPDAIVLNPTDLQNFRLMKDKNGQYYFGGPFTGSYGQPGSPGFVLFIWGLPVVWTTSIAAGTALVGAFRMGAQIFRKLGLTIETTNSDASDFQYNRIAIRANTRLTLACYRPTAFCTVTGLN